MLQVTGKDFIYAMTVLPLSFINCVAQNRLGKLGETRNKQPQ